jgi:transposase InsO family protein
MFQMAWKEIEVIEQRMAFIRDWKAQRWTKAELCRRYEISRQCGYKWLRRYQQQGLAGLHDRPRAPQQHPNQVSAEMESKILEARGIDPQMGALKLQAKLRDQPRIERVGRVPAASTIGEILRRHGLTVKRKRRSRVEPRQEPLTEANHSNAVWCADFKGNFDTQDGARCDPLTITDAYSRYLLRCQIVAGCDFVSCRRLFEAAFREYGLPEVLRTDNGPPFAAPVSCWGLSRLAVWWIKLGIWPERIAPARPDQNGRHERMHRTLKQYTASPPAANLRAQQKRFDEFRRQYNEQRPHQALGQRVPASFYRCSPRSYPSRLREVEYSERLVLRHVQSGEFCWKMGRVFLSRVLDGETIGLEAIDERYWRVWFSFYPLGIFDAHTKRLVRPRRRAQDLVGGTTSVALRAPCAPPNQIQEQPQGSKKHGQAQQEKDC